MTIRHTWKPKILKKDVEPNVIKRELIVNTNAKLSVTLEMNAQMNLEMLKLKSSVLVVTDISPLFVTDTMKGMKKRKQRKLNAIQNVSKTREMLR